MGDRYVLTGVQLGILMSNTDEKFRMKVLNEIMNNQLLEDIVELKVGDRKFALSQQDAILGDDAK